MLLAFTKNIPHRLLQTISCFLNISHSVTMVIVLISLQTLVYIEYCNLIGFATSVVVAQVPYAMGWWRQTRVLQDVLWSTHEFSGHQCNC